MSSLTVSNILGNPSINTTSINSSGNINAVSYSTNGSVVLTGNSTITQLQIAGSNTIVANSTVTTLAVGGTTGLTVNTTAAVFAGTVSDSTATLRPLVVMSSVTLTTQATVDFTSIPSWVRKITVIFYGVSLSGGDQPLIQLGTSGGFVTTGYQSYNSDSGRTSTAGFIGPGGLAADSRYGLFKLALLDNLGSWVCTGICSSSTSNEQRTVGNVNLAASLTQVRLTRTGTNTFDAGFINVIYE